MRRAGAVVERLSEQLRAVSSPELVGGLAALLVVLVVVLAVRSMLLVRSARSDRVEVAMVPTSSFDPSSEEVMRWAAQLLRTNRVTGRMAPDGARVVRVAFQSVGEGRMVQMVSGPGRVESLLRQSGLGEVELVDMAGLAERIGGIDPTDPTGVDQAAGSDQEPEGGEGSRPDLGEVRVGDSVVGDPEEAIEWPEVGEEAWVEDRAGGDGAGEIVWTPRGGDR